MSEFEADRGKLTSTGPDPSLIERLVEFLKEQGGRLDGVEIKKTRFGNDYGLYANESLPDDKRVLISIPYHMCISLDTIVSSEMSVIFNDEHFGGIVQYPDEVMALGLMAALSPSTNLPWALHVMTMPHEFKQSTLFWEEHELEELAPCSTYHLTKLMQSQIQIDWDTIHAPIKEAYPQFLSTATVDTYKWALSMIYSRAVGFHRQRGRTEEYVRCIPPLLDMANHFPTSTQYDASDTFRFDASTSSLQLLSISRKETGQEVFAIYGTYPNSKLAFSYGFVIYNNPYQAIDLWAKITPQVLMGEQKQAILQSNKLTSNQTYDFEGTIRPNYISPALLSTVRIIQCNDAEIKSGNYKNTFEGVMISFRNERATYNALKQLITARMKSEKTEEDERSLKEMLKIKSDARSISTDRKFMALVIRVQERELLRDTLTMLDEWIENLEDFKDDYVVPEKSKVGRKEDEDLPQGMAQELD